MTQLLIFESFSLFFNHFHGLFLLWEHLLPVLQVTIDFIHNLRPNLYHLILFSLVVLGFPCFLVELFLLLLAFSPGCFHLLLLLLALLLILFYSFLPQFPLLLHDLDPPLPVRHSDLPHQFQVPQDDGEIEVGGSHQLKIDFLHRSQDPVPFEVALARCLWLTSPGVIGVYFFYEAILVEVLLGFPQVDQIGTDYVDVLLGDSIEVEPVLEDFLELEHFGMKYLLKEGLIPLITQVLLDLFDSESVHFQLHELLILFELLHFFAAGELLVFFFSQLAKCLLMAALDFILQLQVPLDILFNVFEFSALPFLLQIVDQLLHLILLFFPDFPVLAQSVHSQNEAPFHKLKIFQLRLGKLSTFDLKVLLHFLQLLLIGSFARFLIVGLSELGLPLFHFSLEVLQCLLICLSLDDIGIQNFF